MNRCLSGCRLDLLVLTSLCGLAFVPVHPSPAKDDKSPTVRSVPMYGGTAQRNMVNSVEKNIPAEWDVQKKQNIKWSAQLGNTSYGGPVIAGGKVFIRTNNGNPRDPKVKGDKGILMCFQESDGKFLWQAVHDKLPNPQEN